MRTKTAARIRKAKIQKYYYNSLKIAAEMEKEAFSMDEVLQPAFWGRVIPRLALNSALTLLALIGMILSSVVKGYIRESYPGKDKLTLGAGIATTITFIAISWAVHILAMDFIRKKEATGLSWVGFIKSLTTTSKSEVADVAAKLLNRNDPRIVKSLQVAVNPDGSVNKNKLMSLMAKMT